MISYKSFREQNEHEKIKIKIKKLLTNMKQCDILNELSHMTTTNKKNLDN